MVFHQGFRQNIPYLLKFRYKKFFLFLLQFSHITGQILTNSRTETDLRPEKIGRKIRDAQLEKVPYMLVIGEQEAENGEVAVRQRGKGDIGKMKFEDFVTMVKAQVKALEIW